MQKLYEIVSCKVCGNDLKSWPNRPHKYCSNICTNADPEYKAKRLIQADKMRGRARIKRNCLECNIECEVLASQVKRGKGLTCSKECSYRLRSGPKNPRWRGGISSEDDNERILFQRTVGKQVKSRDKYRCVMCRQKGSLHVDHIKGWAAYPKLRFDPENCRTLCIPCHFEVTYGYPMPLNSKWGLGGLHRSKI